MCLDSMHNTQHLCVVRVAGLLLTPGCQLSIQEWKAMKSMSGEAWSATASCPVAGTQLTHPAACHQHSMAYHCNVSMLESL